MTEMEPRATGESISDSSAGQSFRQCFRVYGLTFESDVPFPALNPNVCDGEPDVVVRQESLPWVGQPPAHGSIVCWSTADEAGFNVPKLGEFLVRNGREILYDLSPDVESVRVSPFVIGVAMSLLLHQRGYLVLHGSAVEHEGNCFAFVATKYRGKSTISAALQARGCRLVTDDLIPILIDADGVPRVTPGYPFSKVWPDAFKALGEDAEIFPRFLQGFEKRLRTVSADAMAPAPSNLRRIYALEWGDEIALKPFSRAEAFQQAVTHTHHHVMPQIAATPARQIAHFKALGGVLRNVTVCRLERPKSLDRLDETCRRLFEDFQRT